MEDRSSITTSVKIATMKIIATNIRIHTSLTIVLDV